MIVIQDDAGRLLWFHGPIAVMLLLNLVGSSMIIRKLCASDKQMGNLSLNIRDPKKRSKNMDK